MQNTYWMPTRLHAGTAATAAYAAALRTYPASLRVQRRTERHLRELRKSLQCIDLGLPSDVAVVARGSLARGDFCPFSDIDLTFVSSHAGSLSAEEIDAALVARFGGEFAVHVVRPDFGESAGTWAELYWVLRSPFIHGNLLTYRQFRDSGRAVLRELAPAALSASWSADLRRDPRGHRVDAIRTNVKRGLGGIFDWDYINLVHEWSRLSNHRRLAYSLALHRSRVMFWYLRSLKFYLQVAHAAPRETPLEDHVRARSAPAALPAPFAESAFASVQVEHHRIVEDVNTLLKEE